MEERVPVVVEDVNGLLPLLFGRTRRAIEIRKAWNENRFALVLTPPILDELERVLTYPKVRKNFALDDDDVAQALTILRQNARNFPGVYTDVRIIEADPSDNIYLAAALESGADYLVTQDEHLLSLKYYQGTQIISLHQFAQFLGIE